MCRLHTSGSQHVTLDFGYAVLATFITVNEYTNIPHSIFLCQLSQVASGSGH